MGTTVKYLFVILAVILLFGGCSKKKPSKPVKILVERDPIVKILEEQDSMVIYENDSVKRIIPKQE